MSESRLRLITVLLRMTICVMVMSKIVAASDDVVRVFVFAGQSNMVGADAHADQIDRYPNFRGAGEVQDDVLYSYILGSSGEASDGWVNLKPLESFGPELTFARRVKQLSPGPIAIIKSAVGGTTVAFDWNPDAPDEGQKLYPRTLQLIQESLRKLDERGLRYRLEGVMWHQGENDMLNRDLYRQYATGLQSLIARLRTDLNSPELKWYIAEVSEKGIWGMDHRSNLGVLHEQQQQVLNSDPLTRWVPTSHLAFEIMKNGQPHYHFGTQGQLQMGEAFADAWLNDSGQAAAASERRFRNGLPVTSKGHVRLFVLAGQRTIEGEDSFVSEISTIPEFKHLADNQPDVMFRYSMGGGFQTSKDWEPLGPTGFLGNFGPELSFGATLRKSIPAEDAIAIVKFTHSGAQGPDWRPEGSEESHRDLFRRYLQFIRDAQQDLIDRGLTCSLEGVWWHPGENDTFFGPYVENHAKWLQRLIDQSRVELDAPDLRWFISEQHPQFRWPHVERVNTQLIRMSESDPRITLIKTAQLPCQSFLWGTEGTLRLGQEMGKAYSIQP